MSDTEKQTDKKPLTIGGWVAKYNSPSVAVKLPSGAMASEKYLPGAFADSVDAINAGIATIEANIEHADNAFSRVGLTGLNVKVENRAEGVYATVELTPDTVGADIFGKIEKGIVRGLSAEFIPVDGFPCHVTRSADGGFVQAWPKLKLTGFAITVSPFYPESQIVEAGGAMLRSMSTVELQKMDDAIRIYLEWVEGELEYWRRMLLLL